MTIFPLTVGNPANPQSRHFVIASTPQEAIKTWHKENGTFYRTQHQITVFVKDGTTLHECTIMHPGQGEITEIPQPFAIDGLC